MWHVYPSPVHAHGGLWPYGQVKPVAHGSPLAALRAMFSLYAEVVVYGAGSLGGYVPHALPVGVVVGGHQDVLRAVWAMGLGYVQGQLLARGGVILDVKDNIHG